MKKIFSICFLVSLFYNATAQVTFQKTYRDGLLNYTVRKSLYFNDGSILLTGKKPGINTGQPYLIGLDSLGNINWTKEYNMINGGGQSFYATKDNVNNIVLLGGYGDTITYESDPFLFKTDSAGNFIWGKVYGDTLDNLAELNCNLKNGYLIYVHTVINSSDKIFRCDLIKTNLNGDIQWSKQYFDSSDTRFNYFEEVDNGNILVLGSTNLYDSVYKGIKCILDSNGLVLEAKLLNDSNGYNTVLTDRLKIENEFYYIGTKEFYQTPFNTGGLLITKTDTNDNIIWSKLFGQNIIGNFISPMYIGNGQIIIGGGGGYMLMNIDTSGNILWSKSYQFTNQNIFITSAHLCMDSGFILTGTCGNPYTIYCLKTDKTGNAGCFTNSNSPLIQPCQMYFTPVQPPVYSSYFNTINLGVNVSIFNLADSVYCFSVGETENPSSISTIKIYPNPFDDFISIAINGFNSEESLKLDVYDATGKSVYNENLKLELSTINLSRLKSGLYLIKISSNSKQFNYKIFKPN